MFFMIFICKVMFLTSMVVNMSISTTQNQTTFGFDVMLRKLLTPTIRPTAMTVDTLHTYASCSHVRLTQSDHRQL